MKLSWFKSVRQEEGEKNDLHDQYLIECTALANCPEGLNGYFRDSGFDQNTVRESGKR